MTTSVGPGTLDPLDDRALAPVGRWDAARIIARVGRALWMRDRAVAEVRWAAITLGTMGLLALLAKAIDPEDTQFHAAILLTWPATIVAILVGWTPFGQRLVQHRGVRMSLGPLVLIIAAAACGGIDVATLVMPSAGPFVVLAVTFAAVTPSYGLTAAILLTAATAVGLAHAGMATRGLVDGDLVSDEYVVRVAVVLLASTGLAVVVRIATTAEERAVRRAARSRRRVDALESLEHIVRRFDGSRTVREVIQDVVDDVSREFEIALVSMYLPDEQGRLSMVGVAGYHSPFHVIEPGVGVIGRAASTLETQYVPDVLADPDYRAARDDVRSEIAAPIVHHGELLGIVNFEGTLDRPMTPAHVALADTIARAIAAALRSARLDEERRARLHAIERVLDVSRGLVGDLDRARTVRAVVDAAADLLGADPILIAGLGVDGTFRVEAETSAVPTAGGSERVTGDARPLTPDDAAALEAIETGERVIRPAPSIDGEAPRSVLALPIRIDDRVTAVLTATRPSAAPFGEVELGIADLLVTQVAVALRNADRHAMVSDAAVRDPLTGLLNRRYFDEAVEAAFAHARRHQTPLSLIVLDLDRFSAVNNEHGHAVGDAVLRRVSQAMQGAVRLEDTAARYGGEEFVVIAPGAGAAEAVVVAERIRTAVAAAAADAVTIDGRPVPLTISAGVASLLGDELDGHALFRAADSALLTAKRAGRDRVVAV
ncbi:MAG TPA: diguanylate cyclase [Candidatus Saccharimonadales bacterium]|nr:diguanylate cyclase [Candidatus Saccharimonadales bacterium]